MSSSNSEVDSPFLFANEAARYLRLSERTLEYYRIYGGGPAYRKHGHRILYHKSELETWSSSRRYTSTGGGKLPPDGDTKHSQK